MLAWIGALVLAAAPAAAQAGAPLAPDGQRGLGASTPLKDIQRMLRRPAPADAQFLAALDALDAEVRTLAGLARERYRERGYFALLEGKAEDDIAALHAAFRAAEQHSSDALRKDEAYALAYARMYFDVRMRMRMQVLELFEDEARDLRAGLAVLRATNDGYVELDPVQTKAIVARVDLAASLLRAMKSDLGALKGPPDASDFDAQDEAKAQALFAAARAKEKDEERAFQVARWEEELATRKHQMQETLATARLTARVQPQLDARAKALAQGRSAEQQARTLLPDTTEGAEAPPEVAKLSKTQRIKSARDTAFGGLVLDPLSEELDWIVAKSADFFDGRRMSRPFFDRYLALRGIRANEWKTFGGRTLTANEREALDEVQGTSPLR